MKYTLCVTQQCNLRCTYCYVDKSRARMSLATAERIIDFLYRHTPPDEDIDIAFFGGEPLTEFKLIQAITERIENHPDYDPERVELTLVSNGTIYNDRIEDFLAEHGFGFGISCDGPPRVHDRYRLFVNGRGSSARVEQTIRRAARRFPDLMVNAVYRPDTVAYLPETVEYLASLGVVRIYLNPDFSAPWTAEHAARLPEHVMARIIKIWEAGGPRDFWVHEAALIRKFIARNKIKAMSSRAQLERTMAPEMSAQAVAALAAPKVKAAELPKVLKRLGFPGGMEAPHLHFEGKIYPLDSKQWKNFSALALESFRARLDKAKVVNFDQVASLGDAIAKLG